MVVAFALAAVAVASVAALLGYTAYGARTAQGQHSTQAHSTPPPTATPSPTVAPTATAHPTATATANPNAAIEAEVKGSFSAITLTTEVDESCSAVPSSSTFNRNQKIYINVCMSDKVASGTMSIYMRQGETTLFTVTTNQYLVAGGSLPFEAMVDEYGAFNILVTVTIKGQQYIADILNFTVS